MHCVRVCTDYTLYNNRLFSRRSLVTCSATVIPRLKSAIFCFVNWCEMLQYLQTYRTTVQVSVLLTCTTITTTCTCTVPVLQKVETTQKNKQVFFCGYRCYSCNGVNVYAPAPHTKAKVYSVPACTGAVLYNCNPWYR